jgi:hypothetical protein
MRHTSALLLALACACGSDDEVGEGSGTLEVRARVQAENLLSNASDASDFRTTVSVTVVRDGALVSDAVVRIGTGRGDSELTREGDQYVAVLGSYEGSYRLDVTAGSDYVRGVQLAGPDPHSFAAPLPGTTVAAADLEVSWSRDDAADSAHIDTAEMDRLAIVDSGTYTVPYAQLKHDSKEIKEERIRLWRSNQLLPAGSVGDSLFVVEVRNEIEILVSPGG